MPSPSEGGDLMRQQHQELMCWHLARTNTDKRNSCSQSVGASFSSCFLLLSVFSLLQMWLREPLPWQSTQRNLLLWVILHWTATCQERQLIFTKPHAQTPLLDYSWIFFSLSLHIHPAHSRHCCATTLPLTADGAFWHFGTGGTCSVTEWLVAKMSSASEGVSDWANRRDGGVKILHSTTLSLCHLPTHSFILRVGLMLVGLAKCIH